MTRRDPDSVLAGLSDEQRRAVLAPAGPVAIVAGAGTGKTRTVTHRIAYRVAAGELDASQVLAITHSRKAASELRERLGGLGVGATNVRTFHAQALYQLTRTRGRDQISIVEPSHKWRMIKDAARDVCGPVSDTQLRDIHDEIAWAQTQLIDADTYTEMSRSRDGVDADVIRAIYGRYTDTKRRAGTFDFDDLLVEAAADAQAGRANAVIENLDAITVDEYQDVDPAQQHLLDAWLAGRRDITAVGDARQAIYFFKGASSDYLLKFTDRYPGGVEVHLTDNYRSTPQILTVANKIADGFPALRAVNGTTGPDVTVHWAASIDNETDQVVAQLREWERSGIGWGDMAVLYRFNSSAARLETALGAAHIPTQIAGGDDSFWDRPDVRAVLVPYGQAARANPTASGLDLLAQITANVGWNADSPPEGAGAQRERWELVAALVRLAESHADTTTDAATLLGALQTAYRDTHIPHRGGVSLGTVHKAKGLEHRCVIIVEAIDGVFPAFYAETREELEEERNICYVAVTRAKEHLVILVPLTNNRKQRCDPSPIYTSAVGGRRSAGGARRGRTASGRSGGRAPIAASPPAAIERLVVTSTCKGCGEKLRSMPDRNLGWHLDCIDEPALEARRDALIDYAQQHSSQVRLDKSGISRLLAGRNLNALQVAATAGVTVDGEHAAQIAQLLRH